MKRLLLVALLTVTGCTHQMTPEERAAYFVPPPTPEQLAQKEREREKPKWVNADWNKKIAADPAQKESAARGYRMDEAACSVEASRIAVPMPVESGPRHVGCFQGGICVGTGHTRDTMATMQALADRVSIWRNCLVARGWDEVSVEEARANKRECLDAHCNAAYYPATATP